MTPSPASERALMAPTDACSGYVVISIAVNSTGILLHYNVDHLYVTH